MKRSVYFIKFESKYWHGASDMYTTVAADSEDEARYLAEAKIEKALADAGYENDPGHITRIVDLR